MAALSAHSQRLNAVSIGGFDTETVHTDYDKTCRAVRLRFRFIQCAPFHRPNARRNESFVQPLVGSHSLAQAVVLGRAIRKTSVGDFRLNEAPRIVSYLTSPNAGFDERRSTQFAGRARSHPNANLANLQAGTIREQISKSMLAFCFRRTFTLVDGR